MGFLPATTLQIILLETTETQIVLGDGVQCIQGEVEVWELISNHANQKFHYFLKLFMYNVYVL